MQQADSQRYSGDTSRTCERCLPPALEALLHKFHEAIKRRRHGDRQGKPEWPYEVLNRPKACGKANVTIAIDHNRFALCIVFS